MLFLRFPWLRSPAGASPREVWAEPGQAAWLDLEVSSGCRLTARFPVALIQTGDWLGSRVVTSGLEPVV